MCVPRSRSSACFWLGAETVTVTTAEKALPGDATTSPEMLSTESVWPAVSVPLKRSVRVAEPCSALPVETSMRKRPSARRIQTASRSARAVGDSCASEPAARGRSSFRVFIV